MSDYATMTEAIPEIRTLLDRQAEDHARLARIALDAVLEAEGLRRHRAEALAEIEALEQVLRDNRALVGAPTDVQMAATLRLNNALRLCGSERVRCVVLVGKLPPRAAAPALKVIDGGPGRRDEDEDQDAIDDLASFGTTEGGETL